MFVSGSLFPGVLSDAKIERVHVVTLSPISALLPNTNKIKLQELAKDELLASLNEPFDKEVQENGVGDEDKDQVDYTAADDEQNALLQLTELKRIKVIEEIFETEKKYIYCLETVDKVFKTPMLDGGIAQDKDVHALFPSCLSIIKECHEWFMEQLENRINCVDYEGSIGDILGKMAGPLKDNLLNIYTDYVNAFPKSISTFSKCTRTSHKFRRFIEECYEKSDNLDLPSYLITPVQRLPRYVLLLRQLSKYTRDDHPDNDSITSALLQMEELIQSLNGSIQSSMHMYTSRDGDHRKSIRRQLSRKRKKPRPVSLSLKDGKTVDEKMSKAGSPDHMDSSVSANGPAGSPHISTVMEENENVQQDDKDKETVGKRASLPDNWERHLRAPPSHLRPVTPDHVRKSKSENRKSLRKSIGAALSSIWSPKDERDLKDVHDQLKDQAEGSEQTPDISDRTSSPSQRKYGISYSQPASGVTNSSAESTPLKPRQNGINRVSNSFREKTRNFQIKMRRRSGTWFSVTEEHKASDTDLSYRSPSGTVISAEDTKVKPTSRGSSLISIFSKKKSKHGQDEGISRRRSDSDREVKVCSDYEHRTISSSVSSPLFGNKRKDSKAVSINSSIYEESCDSETDQGSSLSPIRAKNNNCANGSNGNLIASAMDEDDRADTAAKRHKKGKIMKTLRNMLGKGK